MNKKRLTESEANFKMNQDFFLKKAEMNIIRRLPLASCQNSQAQMLDTSVT